MGGQLTTSAEALRLFFDDDVYLIRTEQEIPAAASTETRNPEPEVKHAVPEIKLPETASENVQPVVTTPEPVSFSYLGKNQKNILILVNDSQHDVSTAQGRELLRNIVKAIQLTANDFALMNYSAYTGTGFTELDGFFASKLVMSFGVTPTQLGLTDYEKNILHLQGTTQLVFSENLDQLAGDLQGKKTLWASLKQITL